ncbi:hypothetical protein F8C76_13360 [Flagellimonas olearia]|uniref:Cadherin domain-containing protein n=1 Tax=Flagellimonas olearia TaxID=552546 RepID=A0A6I1DV76_9FLAO|nr:hypothetical protein [Allomuricauda olearia]KAB7528838.1 hypothetical protein F8C76_13360 [Allomuricauda olearia]
MAFKNLFPRPLLALSIIILLASCSVNGDSENSTPPETTVEDSIAPTLTVSGIVENETLSEPQELTLSLADNSGDNLLLEAFLDGVLIYSSSTDYTFELDPNLFAPGEKTIRFVASDDAKNSTSVNVRFIIKRVLVKLSLEENYFRNPIEEAFAFASRNDGVVLDSIILTENAELKLLAPFDFDASEEFVLTIITKNTNGPIDLESIPHLKVAETNNFLLTNQGRFNYETIEVNYAATGFPELEGLGYSYIFFSPDDPTGTLDLLDRFDPPAHIFLKAAGGSVDGEHFYTKIKRDTISSPLLLELDDFTSEHVTVGNFPYTENSVIDIYGFESYADFEADKPHNARFNVGQIVSQNSIRIPYIDNFTYYRHTYVDLYGSNLNGYRYMGEGLPLEDYNPLGTTLVTTLVDNKLLIDFIPLPDYHSGKVHLKSINQNSNWVFNFDASNSEELTLPEIPNFSGMEELAGLTYEIKSTRISSYSNIGSFEDYLNIAKKDNLRYYEHSEKVEHITVWPSMDNRESFIDPSY